MNSATSRRNIMAARIIHEAGDDTGRQVERAYWLTLSRAPTDHERRQGAEFVAQQVQIEAAAPADRSEHSGAATPSSLSRRALADFCHVLFNSNEFVYVN